MSTVGAKFLTNEVNQQGRVDRVSAWKNFILSVGEWGDRVSALKEYNARFVLGYSMNEDHLLFDTEQDMMLFLLRWS